MSDIKVVDEHMGLTSIQKSDIVRLSCGTFTHREIANLYKVRVSVVDEIVDESVRKGEYQNISLQEGGQSAKERAASYIQMTSTNLASKMVSNANKLNDTKTGVLGVLLDRFSKDPSYVCTPEYEAYKDMSKLLGQHEAAEVSNASMLARMSRNMESEKKGETMVLIENESVVRKTRSEHVRAMFGIEGDDE